MFGFKMFLEDILNLYVFTRFHFCCVVTLVTLVTELVDSVCG